MNYSIFLQNNLFQHLLSLIFTKKVLKVGDVRSKNYATISQTTNFTSRACAQLLGITLVLLQPDVLREALVAFGALVGFDFGMRPLVHDQILHLPEVLAAIITAEWFLVAMDPLVDLEIIVAGHGLPAHIANDLSPGVHLHMRLDRVLPEARVVADLAHVLLGPALRIVHPRVQVQTSLVGIAGVADLADEGLGAGVTENVPLQDVLAGEALVADIAADLVVVHVVALVLLDVVDTGRLEVAEPTAKRAVFVLCLDVVLAAILGTEELLTGLATVGNAVLAATWVAR